MATDYKVLYEQVQAAFQELQAEYEEMKETSKLLEGELEDQVKCMEEAMEEQQIQTDQAIEKMKEKLATKEAEAVNLEKTLEKTKIELNEAKEKLAKLQKLKVTAENENESLEAQVRSKEIKIVELQSDLDSSLTKKLSNISKFFGSLERHLILQEEFNALRESKDVEISELRSLVDRYKEELEFAQRNPAGRKSTRLSEAPRQEPQSLSEIPRPSTSVKKYPPL